MNPSVYLPLFSLLVFVGIFSACYAFLKRRINLKARLLESGPAAGQGGRRQQIASGMESVFAPLGKMLRRSPDDLSKESQRLILAGYRRKNAVFLFYGVRVAVAGLLLALLSLVGMPQGNPVLFVLLPLLMGAALPDLWLRQRIKARQLYLKNVIPYLLEECL